MRISDWSSDVCSSDLKALAKGFARRGGGILARQRVEQAVHRRVFSLVLDRGTATLLLEPDRFFDEIARDLLDFAADIAHFGDLGRLDLAETRIGELRHPPRHLGLPAAGGADTAGVLRLTAVRQIGLAPL